MRRESFHLFHTLVLALLVVLPLLFRASRAQLHPERSLVSRIVVTLKEYNACEVGGALASTGCASVAKCYGRRLVLTLGDDCPLDVRTTLEKAEAWVRGVVDDVSMVEEDTMFAGIAQVDAMDWDSGGIQLPSGVDAARNDNDDDGATDNATIANETNWVQNTDASNTSDGGIQPGSSENNNNNNDNIYQWNLDMINIFDLWLNHSTFGEGYTIAVLDSGLAEGARMAYDEDRLLQGHDFISDPELAMDGDGRDASASDPGDADAQVCPGRPSSWHGSKVTSVLAANVSGFLGVAPGAFVRPVRVLGRCGSGYASDVADAIVWAAGGFINGLGSVGDEGENERKKVISMSFAGKGRCPSYMQSAVDLALENNVTLFAAAGNDPKLLAADHFPANCRGVVSVGALNWKKEIASYSSRGADVYMPGGDAEKPVPCLGHDLSLQGCIGTSIAVPHAAGLRGVDEGSDWSGISEGINIVGDMNNTDSFVQAAGCPAGQYGSTGVTAQYPSQALTSCTTTIGSYTYRAKHSSSDDVNSFPAWKAFDKSSATNLNAFVSVGTYSGPGATATGNIYFAGSTTYNGEYLVIDMGASFVLKSYSIGMPSGWGNGMSVKWKIFGINDLSVWTNGGDCNTGLDTTKAWVELDVRNTATYASEELFLASNTLATRFLAMQANQIRSWGNMHVGEWIIKGYYEVCSPCAQGTYSLADSASCTPCPAGSYSVATGATSIATCTQCGTGTYSLAIGASSSSSCTPCPAGSYSSTTGSSNCTLCPGGTFSTSTGATSSAVCSQACPAGTFSLPGSSNCTACPAGSFSTGPGESGCTPTASVSAESVQSLHGNWDGTTCVKLASQNIKCWGGSAAGTLGYGDSVIRGTSSAQMGNNLTYILFGTGVLVTSVSIGDAHSCVILNGGSKVKCWGIDAGGSLGRENGSPAYGSASYWIGDAPGEMGDSLPDVNLGPELSGGQITATQLTCGYLWTCVLFSNKKIKCWGYGNNGALGYGDYSSRGSSANQMGSSLLFVDLGIGRTATWISSGSSHMCAILDDSSLKCWGYNWNAQLGLGNQDGQSLPQLVDLGGLQVLSVVCSGSFNCAILSNFKVKCWGTNSYGQLGLGHTNIIGDGPNEMGINLPYVDIGTSKTAKKISLGPSHVCAILNDNSLKCWGSNQDGMLGLGNTVSMGDNPGEMGDNLPAVDLGVGRSAIDVKCGASSTCVLLDDNSVKCWGLVTYGRLGIGVSAGLSGTDTYAVGDQAGEMGSNLRNVNLGGITTYSSCPLVPGAATCTACPAGSYSTATNATSNSTCQLCPMGTYSNAGKGGSCTPCPPGTYSATNGTTTLAGCTVCPENTSTPLPGGFTSVASCIPAVSRLVQRTVPSVGLTGYTTTITGQSFGNGVYTVTCSDPYNIGCWPAFDKSLTGYWYLYSNTGSQTYTNGYTFAGTYDLAADGYKGHWAALSIPFSIIPSSIKVSGGGGNSIYYPKDYRFYGKKVGSSTWDLLRQETAATYVGTDHVGNVTLSLPLGEYNQFGFEVNKIIGSATGGNVAEFTVDGLVPADCSAGMYALANTTVCIHCPAGTASSAVGATSISACVTCTPGTYANALTGATACTSCPIGTYSSASGASSIATCTSCLSGYSTPTNASASIASCFACIPGTYFQAGVGCINCPTGTASNVTAAAGTQASVCLPCPAGTFSRAASALCTSCSQGTISSSPAVSILPVTGSTTQYYMQFTSSVQTSSVQFTVTVDCDMLVRMFVIAGGGGGGGNHGGGGGAGAYFYANSSMLFPAGIYTFVVGGGGIGNVIVPGVGYMSDAQPGLDTYIQRRDGVSDFIRVRGGGKGASYGSSAWEIPGIGGCGGGGFGHSGCTVPCAGGLALNTGTNGTGFQGGAGSGSTGYTGGGGGGIAGPGSTAISTTARGNGGDALAINIAGVFNAYGGGGGGGGYSGNPMGGSCGSAMISGIQTCAGGCGAYGITCPPSNLDAVVNTGSGGGCNKDGTGGRGSAGTIILRYGTCSAGQYYSSASGDCAACPAGTYAPLSATLITACTPCSMGTYSTATGATNSSTCIACAVGTYSASVASSSCTQCTAGTASNVTAATSNATCQVCTPGTYSTLLVASSTCTGCPSGKFSALPGASSASNCSSCPSGSFSLASAPNCTFCLAGTFSSSSSSNCTSCPSGSYSNTSSSNCTVCPSGSFSLASAPNCTLCPAGTFAPNPNTSSACTACPVGYASNATGATSNTTCSACGIGQYTPTGAGSSTCSRCPYGTYTNQMATAGACTPCPGDTSTPFLGCTFCKCSPATPIPVNYRAYPPAALLNEFNELTTAPYSNGVYLIRVSSAGDSPNRNYNNIFNRKDNDSPYLGQWGCCGDGVRIEAGDGYRGHSVKLQMPVSISFARIRIYNSNAKNFRVYGGINDFNGPWTILHEVIGVTYSNLEHVSSPSTVSTTAKYNYLMVMVAEATWNNGDLYMGELTFYEAAPSTCPSGLFAVNDTSVSLCLSCYPGTMSTGGAIGPEQCASCIAGTYSGFYGANNCSQCPAGSWSTEIAAVDVSSCQLCPAGMFSPALGANASSTCQTCPAGRMSPVPGSANCTVCGPGTFSAAANATRCDVCPAGYFASGFGNTNCTICPAGSIAAKNASATCTPCNAGTIAANSGLAVCTACLAGNYASGNGSTNCTACPAGQIAAASGSASCAACGPGTIAANSGLSVCAACLAGNYASGSGNTNCTACPAGQIAAANGASTCTICGPGTFSATAGLSVCGICQAGSFAAGNGNLNCTLCPTGTSASSTQSSSCVTCTAGYFALGPGAATCSACGQGYFSNAAGVSACTACPGGQSQSLTGQTSCNPCVAGTYSTAGWAQCQNCAAGYYGTTSQMTSCVACDSGQYQNLTGQTSCKPCNPGLFSAPGAVLCANCEPGLYFLFLFISFLIVILCILAGKYAQNYGSTNCTLCQPGSFANYPGTAQCTKCSLGMFSNATGAVSSTACADCPAGTFANVTGSTVCLPCSSGRYSGRTASSECTLCARGSATASVG